MIGCWTYFRTTPTIHFSSPLLLGYKAHMWERILLMTWTREHANELKCDWIVACEHHEYDNVWWYSVAKWWMEANCKPFTACCVFVCGKYFCCIHAHAYTHTHAHTRTHTKRTVLTGNGRWNYSQMRMKFGGSTTSHSTKTKVQCRVMKENHIGVGVRQTIASAVTVRF